MFWFVVNWQRFVNEVIFGYFTTMRINRCVHSYMSVISGQRRSSRVIQNHLTGYIPDSMRGMNNWNALSRRFSWWWFSSWTEGLNGQGLSLWTDICQGLIGQRRFFKTSKVEVFQNQLIDSRAAPLLFVHLIFSKYSNFITP